MKTALVTGSFDPVTLGHVDLVERASGLFDRVLAISFVNPDKHYCFTEDERVAFMADAFGHLPNVEVGHYSGMVYELVRERQVCAIVRGVRSNQDLDYEIEMAAFNRLHTGGCETIFLPAKKGLEGLSSSAVKRRQAAGEDITKLVTPMVAAALQNKKRSV